MDDLQIKAIALNAACVRLAGIDVGILGKAEHTKIVIEMSKEFEKYLKGEKND